MGTEAAHDAEYRALVAQFAPGSIADDGSYRAAIAILDRLFAREDRRTPAERRYFRSLARNARAYERSPGSPRPARAEPA